MLVLDRKIVSRARVGCGKAPNKKFPESGFLVQSRPETIGNKKIPESSLLLRAFFGLEIEVESFGTNFLSQKRYSFCLFSVGLVERFWAEPSETLIFLISPAFS